MTNTPTRLSSSKDAPSGGADNSKKWILVAISVIAGLLLLRIVTADNDGLSQLALSDGIVLAVSVFVESLPFVFLGIVLSVGFQLWVPTRIVVRILPRAGVPRRAVLSLLGVALPVCECGNVPLARGLMTRGLTVADAMTFLLAAPILNPITIITTYQAFGWDDGILVTRIAGGFILANLIGFVLSRHPAPAALLTPSFAAACHHSATHDAKASGRAAKAVTIFIAETAAMLPALAVGSAIAGAIQVAATRDVLTQLGGHPILGVLALMLLAFVISICSNVDAFFALSLASLFSPGALVAFLVFGPMIDVKMLAIMRTTFTTRALVLVTTVVALGAFALGLAVNFFA